jgi:methyltransferase (TIGR00027 family)
VGWDEDTPMRTTVADTAYAIATIRAEEGDRPPAERLFDDPYARLFAAGGTHAAEGVARFLGLPFFRDGVRLRTRFIDDVVRAGVADGLSQVVLVGAGFDARGMRMSELSGCRVFEVDLPEQLDARRALLAGANVVPPPSTAQVPCDFEAPDFETELGEALAGRGFRRGEGAIFVWEGVIAYLRRESVDRCLAFLAKAGGPGSRVVFDYGSFLFDPESAAERTRRHGFASCEEVAFDELWRRYLPGEPHENAWVVRAAVARV